jgi:glycosyltransferase involved in cell wall biosynthesis
MLRQSTGRYVERLLHYLQEIDTKHEYVVLLRPKDMDGWEPTNKNFTKVACPFKEFTFAEQLGLLKQVRSLKPDLVHFSMVQQPIFYTGKVITTMHDLTTVRFKNPSKNPVIFTIKQIIYKQVNRIAARKSKAIITATEYVKDDVAKFAHVNSRKITVTPEAADRITDSPEPVEGLDDDTKFIMYVGRPFPHKNLGQLIKAFQILKKTHPDLKLVLAGKKDALYKQHAKDVERLEIPDVIFTGFVSEGQLRWLYEHTAAYIFPSLSEGFGLPGLEAMVAGAPVVSSNATCLPEVYGDAAEYFDPLKTEDIAAAIAKVIDNSSHRSKLIAQGSRQAAKYSWKRMAEQTLEVYKQVLGED